MLGNIADNSCSYVRIGIVKLTNLQTRGGNKEQHVHHVRVYCEQQMDTWNVKIFILFGDLAAFAGNASLCVSRSVSPFFRRR